MHPNVRRARGSVLRALVWFVSALLLLAVIAMVAFDWFTRAKYEPTLDAMRQEVTAHVDLFCQEQTKLAADPWFHEPRTEGDAGPLLNRWAEWDRPGPSMPADSPLQLPAHLKEKKTLEEWFAANPDLSALDFNWMRELKRFDRWDIRQNLPFKQEEPFDLMTVPFPNFIVLMEWSKLRLLQGMRTGQPLEAAQDVRHLAWLSYRTDTLIGSMIAYTLLGLERTAHALTKQPPSEWRPMSQEQGDRLRAVFWASKSFSNITTPVEVARKARSCGSGISRCLGLVEASNMAKHLQPLAEPSYREAYAELQKEMATPCPTSVLITQWQHGGTIEDHPPRSGSMPDQAGWMRSLPGRYFAKHIAGVLLTVANQDIDLLKKLPQGQATPASAEAAP
ncbi:hypothetical protein HUA74_19350 [Myxococcus sp. CA051A]|uniref:hypothetical protein n=1 Tax=Myxococcus sp. CA051A TaxID=2741739 RepID=UPI00157A43F7|nr:hypothetical protein [Myxococcus sp. CA051A]NTX62806.1 hypothetical protein [Myxococcus sp. CA051A]